MSGRYISNYDKYPVVLVSDSRNGCETGWEAIARRLKSSIRPGRFLICVECYPGCFEKEIEKQLVDALKPQTVVRAARLLPARNRDSIAVRARFGRRSGLCLHGQVRTPRIPGRARTRKTKNSREPGIGPYARDWHRRNPSRRTVGPARLLRHGEMGDPAAPADWRNPEPRFAELRGAPAGEV